ncbi:MAG: bifunctional 3-(3-hydroxy-phenyl)propionate/3-hydroxycinnamic acid hydroxylase, partial [Actinomycetales bacterium]
MTSDRSGRPVVVVGAGPVGTSAAILLAQHGVPVVLLDRWADVFPQPRAVHLDDEVHRVLARMGVAEEFAAVSRPGRGLRLVDRDLRVLGSFEREGISEASGYPRANMYDQPDLERVLRGRMAALPLITFRGGVEVTGVEADGPVAARVRLREVASGAEETLDASFVLGCDGANSTVRQSIGSSMEDLGFEQRWLVLDVDTSADLRQWEGVQQVCDSRRAATYMRIGETRYRWELRLLDHETADDYATIESLLPLLAPWTRNVPVEELKLVRITSYTFRAAIADRWRSGSVFLLGDAAHLTPPFIGQGLGAGVRDAANLCWKVAGVLAGQLDAEVLDSYEPERSGHARSMILLARRLGVVMTRGGRLGDGLRRLAVPGLALGDGRADHGIGPLLHLLAHRSQRLGGEAVSEHLASLL